MFRQTGCTEQGLKKGDCEIEGDESKSKDVSQRVEGLFTHALLCDNGNHYNYFRRRVQEIDHPPTCLLRIVVRSFK